MLLKIFSNVAIFSTIINALFKISGNSSNQLIHCLFTNAPGEGGSRANPREFTNVAIALAETCETTIQGRSFETIPIAFGVTLTENGEFGGYTGLDSQGQPKTSFTNLRVDIQAVQVPESNHLVSLLRLGLLGIIFKVAKR